MPAMLAQPPPRLPVSGRPRIASVACLFVPAQPRPYRR